MTATDRKQLREFALVLAAATAVLFGLLFPWLGERLWPLWPWLVAAVAVAWGLLLPDSLAPVYRGWMRLGHVLGWVNTRIILGVLFFAMILPVGLVMRLLGHDPLARRRNPDAASYRVRGHHSHSMERPF
jgi:hypothetical protein